MRLALALVCCGCVSAAKPEVNPACPEPAMTGGFKVPAHAAYTHWVFAAPRASSMEYAVRVENDPGSQVGLYLSLLNSSIDGAQFYLGLQTNLARPGTGWVGKGLLFSTWGTFDEADTRLAPGGYLELGTHEGRFAGVRLQYPWTKGEYRVRLSRGAGDERGDWFELFITDVATSKETFIGALRFRRQAATTPATIAPNNLTFLEVYSGATGFSAVPAWTVSLTATADGVSPTSARSEYPAFPFAEFPNAEVAFDAKTRRVNMAVGGRTQRCHAAGPLF